MLALKGAWYNSSMKLFHWTELLIIGAVCFTLSDLRSAECRVACLLGGWKGGGDYVEKLKMCRCFDLKDYETMTQVPRFGVPPIKQVVIHPQE